MEEIAREKNQLQLAEIWGQLWGLTAAEDRVTVRETRLLKPLPGGVPPSTAQQSPRGFQLLSSKLALPTLTCGARDKVGLTVLSRLWGAHLDHRLAPPPEVAAVFSSQ